MMSNHSCANFDLAIERAGEHYRARVLQSYAGEGSAEFDLPFSEYELKYLILQMGHRPRGDERQVRPSDSAELAAAKEFGAKLFGAVFQRDVYACLRASLEEAHSREQGLRVLLRLPPELTSLPWEYLYNPDWNQFLSLSLDTPLVRYLELTPAVRPLAVQAPLRVLVVIASPSDYAPLDVEREWRDLQAALRPLVERGLVAVDRLENPTLVALQSQLRQGKKYHIFHFIGHGQFSERQQDGRLVFCDEQGRGHLLSGQTLGTMLHNHPSLRLALLNACEGARTAQNDPFAGVAHVLVQMGLPAVIAMQYAISDTAAVRFAREFYLALADGYEVDAALTEARTAVFASQGSVEWGTPVLFTRTLDGRIFDLALDAQPARPSGDFGSLVERAPLSNPSAGVPTNRLPKSGGTPPPIAPDMELAHLYEDGLSAFHLEDWARAQECFQAVVQLRRDYRDVIDRLRLAQQQIDLAQRYRQAQELLERSDWPGALEVLEKLTAEAPGYREAPRLLEKVRGEMARSKSEGWGGRLMAWLAVHRREAVVVGLVLVGLGGVIFVLANNFGVPGMAPSNTASATPSQTPTLPPSATSTAPPSVTPTITLTATPTLPVGMVLIPAGPFTMGNQDPQAALAECKKDRSDCSIDWFQDETPAHSVTLNTFLMDVYEVTNADYAQCVTTGKCKVPADKTSSTRTDYYENKQYANYPVINISWEEADIYCKWRGRRLPSEAEWEKAARGKLEGKLYPWGDTTPACTPGVENGAQFYSCSVKDTVAVGSFRPNGYGLFDMAGNAWEWVNDWYYSYSSTSVSNPTVPTSGSNKVLRGGGWNDRLGYLRVASRNSGVPAYRYFTFGFRCAADSP